MTISIPNNFGNATYVWRSNTQAREFTVNMGFYDLPLTADANAAATAHRAALIQTGGPAAPAAMTTQWAFQGVRVLMRNNAGVLVSGSNLTPVNGTATSLSNESPVFTTLIVSKLTAFAGKHYRGRMYVPLTNVAETSIGVGGEVLSTISAPLQTLWNTYFTTLQGGSYIGYLLHDLAGPVIPLPTILSSLLVRPVVGLQRRRRTRGA